MFILFCIFNRLVYYINLFANYRGLQKGMHSLRRIISWQFKKLSQDSSWTRLLIHKENIIMTTIQLTDSPPREANYD
jgi:tRNA-dihydrouridine synthase